MARTNQRTNDCALPCTATTTPPIGACGRRIEGRYVSSQGKQWHNECFQCAGCKVNLEGTTGITLLPSLPSLLLPRADGSALACCCLGRLLRGRRQAVAPRVLQQSAGGHGLPVASAKEVGRDARSLLDAAERHATGAHGRAAQVLHELRRRQSRRQVLQRVRQQAGIERHHRSHSAARLRHCNHRMTARVILLILLLLFNTNNNQYDPIRGTTDASYREVAHTHRDGSMDDE